MDKDFKTLFNETLHNYGVTTAKLAEASGVPERYIEALRAGNAELLPADPYVRGYLMKIVAMTGGSVDELWSAYKKESGNKTSGPSDRMPTNRFSLQKISKGNVALGAVVAALLLYGVLRFDIILGNPELTVVSPKEELLTSSVNFVVLSGMVSTKDKLTINGESVIVEDDGSWSTTWPLTLGTNTLQIKARRFLGKEEVVVKRVVYAPPAEVAGTATSTTTSSSSLLQQ